MGTAPPPSTLGAAPCPPAGLPVPVQRSLRWGLGVVFLWFGALKFVPGLSPAEALVARTVCWAVDPAWFLPLLATWECAIGLGLLFGRYLRVTLLLMALHMAGTFLPLLVCPEDVWTRFPYAWTLEGQYILKNLVLIAAGMAVAGCDRTPLRGAR